MSSITLVTTLELNENVEEMLVLKCDRATELGYRLASTYTHLDRLVLVFQLVDHENVDRENVGNF